MPRAVPSDAPEFLLRLNNAGYRQGEHWRVRSVSFNLSRGEIVSLIGPNGAGKSTLVRLALGLLQTSEGSVWRAPGLRLGYCPQSADPKPLLPISVARYLSLAGRSAASEITMQQTLSLTNAEHLLGKALASLSGGEMRRVMLARALLHQPDLLVLDEPASGLDINGEAALHDLITRLAQDQHCGILLVSHDLHFVLAGSSHVVCINGHVCCSGAPAVLQQDEQFLALFGRAPIGAPSSAPILAPYIHHHDHIHH